MKNLYNINDPHCGAIRTGGTTPATSVALRHATLDSFRSLLTRCDDGNVIINGDLFDAFMIPFHDLWSTVDAVDEWFEAHPGAQMYAARGNHDIAKNSFNMSSFDLFCKITQAMHPGEFWPITGGTYLANHDAYVLPHLPNQDLFDQALKAMPKCRLLFVHANYDNKFAVESDHSLNMSPEQAEAAPCEFIIFGHEHQRRSELKGKVVIVGNQIPTSVADCLGNDAKYLLKIGEVLEHVPVWDAKEDFARIDWRDLAMQRMTNPPRQAALEIKQRFIRVEGDATSAEAAQVVSAISKLRSKSDALVITNAVSIDGIRADEEMKLSLEEAKGFDVLAALLELLDEGFERDTVTAIIKDHNVQTTQAE